jgi:release factor glutamine methyltransferase
VTATTSGTVAEALGAATDALSAAGCETARLDAELLLGEATGLDRAALAASPEAPVDASAGRRFGEMVRRRVRREPVAYILGRKGFRNIEVAVDPRVLIPRPETELLVEVAAGLEPRTVLDVGTGSGAVALAIADELKTAQVRGTDVSAGAIEVAQANAERLGLSDRVHFQLLAGSFSYREGNRQVTDRYDLVVANLPYVTDAEWETLAPEIREHEPREGLVGGPDGLDPIRNLVASLPACDALALEVGQGQAQAVEELVRRAGFVSSDRRPDLAGIDRVVVGRR